LLWTFAVLVVQSAGQAANTFNPLALLIGTVDRGLGTVFGSFMALCLLLYFLLIPVALNVCFARLLLAAAADRHVSIWFARLNRQGVPLHALLTQILIAAGFTVVMYFVAPAFAFLGDPASLNSIAYNVIGACVLLIWAISFLFPFVDLAVLARRDWTTFRRHAVIPPFLLAVSVVMGPVLCIVTIFSTLFNSFIPQLIPSHIWWYVVGSGAVLSLLLCGISSLLSNSQANWEVFHEETQSSS
jgi:amino acid transporter